MFSMTRKQMECLEFIKDAQKRTGTVPTFEEMRVALGLNSRSGVARLLNGLEERGLVRRLERRARAIEVIDAPTYKHCPHCGGSLAQ